MSHIQQWNLKTRVQHVPSLLKSNYAFKLILVEQSCKWRWNKLIYPSHKRISVFPSCSLFTCKRFQSSTAWAKSLNKYRFSGSRRVRRRQSVNILRAGILHHTFKHTHVHLKILPPLMWKILCRLVLKACPGNCHMENRINDTYQLRFEAEILIIIRRKIILKSIQIGHTVTSVCWIKKPWTYKPTNNV